MNIITDPSGLSHPELPIPKPSELSRPHWDACKQGILLVQRCSNCNSYVFTPASVCSTCFSNELRWVESSGLGTLYSFTVVQRAQQAEYPTPYINAIVELQEQWFMLSNIVDCPPDDLKIGMPLQVCFVERADMVLPMFQRHVSPVKK